MKNWFLFLSIVLGLNLSSHADSAARQDRGASCTDYCTKGGKYSIKNVMDGPSPVIRLYKLLCTEGKKKEPNNVHWCKANCLGEGGLWSKLKGRKKDVEDFINASEKLCRETKAAYKVD